MKVSDVLAQVCEPGRLEAAWQQVRKNAGAAGIDRMTVEEFALREEGLLRLIHDKLQSRSYRFKPARRVLIPKEGTPSKKRKLGIPVVMDRVVGVSMYSVLEALFAQLGDTGKLRVAILGTDPRELVPDRTYQAS